MVSDRDGERGLDGWVRAERKEESLEASVGSGLLALAFRKLHAAIWLLAVRPIGKYRQGTCQSANGSWSHGPTTLHGYIATS